MAAARTWYSSLPSCRLMIWLDTTMGASPSSRVTSRDMRARWRSVKLTMRVEQIRTRLPEAVRTSMSRVCIPVRKSRARS